MLNTDDIVGGEWYRAMGKAATGFGVHIGDVKAIPSQVGLHQVDFEIVSNGQRQSVTIPVGGIFSVLNGLAAATTVLALGYDLKSIAEAFRNVRAVPGRFEPIVSTEGVTAIIDYAHTPDALVKLLDSVRLLKKGRLIVVFGCGGDRDKAKRPLMASAVTERADFSILTSDNPRTEDPVSILLDIEKGVAPSAKYLVQEDRRLAIHDAMSLAGPGDVVVIAGKGHENYQLVGSQVLPFDDREVAREALGVAL